MHIYFVVTSTIIILFSCVFLLLFKNNKYINYWTVGTISVGSLLINMSFPRIIASLIEKFNPKDNAYIYAYIFFIFIILCILCTKIGFMMDNGGILNSLIRISIQKVHDFKLNHKLCLDGKLVEYYDSIANSQRPEVQDEIAHGKNIKEKSVDREKNIDTMGLEAKNEKQKVYLSQNEIIRTNNEPATKAIQQDKSKEIVKNKYSNSNSNIDEYEVNEDYFDNTDLIDDKDVIQVKSEKDNELDWENNISADIYEMFGIVNELEENEQDSSIDMSEVEEIIQTIDKIEMKSDDDGKIDKVREASVKKSKDLFEKTNKVEFYEQNNIVTQSVFNYMDEAFRLKETGDYEGSIFNYLNALDMQPDDEVVFWIILDVCVLYKELGQSELANDILQSYSSIYGDIMEPSVKCEIEKNLL